MENMNTAANNAETLNKKLDDVIHNQAENMTASSLADLALMMSSLKKAKTGNFVKDNKNLIGGVIGCVVATGLELASPTGSKASAIMAAAASGGTLYATRKLLDNAPQSTGIAATAAGLTAYVGMVAGRITADYFPGNLSIEE